MRKLTYEQVKGAIEEVGYELLSKEYKTAHTKMEVKCDKGHIYAPTWNNFKKGARCSHCSGKAKHTYNIVKNDIENENYKLLSEKYIGVNNKLKLQCPNGNVWSVSYKYWKSGNRCNCIECSKIKRYHSHKYTQEEVNNIIGNRGFELKSEYKGPSEKINIKCPNGHNIDIYFGNFTKGHGCKYCAWENNRQYYNLTLWEIYNKTCRNISRRIYKENRYLINPYDLEISRHKFHIDHVYSISDGYKNNIPPYIISSVSNLQPLWCYDNISKNKESWITKKELIDNYFNYFEELNGIKDTL